MKALLDKVFSIQDAGQTVWKVRVAGQVLEAEWLDEGAAKAGLATEQRRAAVRRHRMLVINKQSGAVT